LSRGAIRGLRWSSVAWFFFSPHSVWLEDFRRDLTRSTVRFFSPCHNFQTPLPFVWRVHKVPVDSALLVVPFPFGFDSSIFLFSQCNPLEPAFGSLRKRFVVLPLMSLDSKNGHLLPRRFRDSCFPSGGSVTCYFPFLVCTEVCDCSSPILVSRLSFVIARALFNLVNQFDHHLHLFDFSPGSFLPIDPPLIPWETGVQRVSPLLP